MAVVVWGTLAADLAPEHTLAAIARPLAFAATSLIAVTRVIAMTAFPSQIAASLCTGLIGFAAARCVKKLTTTLHRCHLTDHPPYDRVVNVVTRGDASKPLRACTHSCTGIPR